MDLPQVILDYQKRARRLKRFDAGLDSILKAALGRDWLTAKPEDEARLLTPLQRGWRELRYFFEASIVNNGDLFGYLYIVYSRRELFEQIGAVKTLTAAEKLKQLHTTYSQLPTWEERGNYWHETREQRAPIENAAEDMCEFADLLIRFAERHPTELPEVEAPWHRASEIIESFWRKAEEAGNDESV